MQYHSWTQIINKVSDGRFRRGLSSFVNPYSMLLLEKNENVANNIDYWYIDGISLVNCINQSFKTNFDRASFDDTSLAPVVFKFVAKNNFKAAIVGTKEALIGKAVSNIEKKYSVTISYFRNGYFNSFQEKENCYKDLINNKIDVVIVGMGTPYQEEFLIDLKQQGWDGYGFTCGGYLHQIASRENYYPTFFDKYNIRWIYRIFDEPQLFKRYAVDYLRFFYKFAKYIRTLTSSKLV